MSGGRLVQVNVSDGGVPKLPVPTARVTRAGVEGDRQNEATVHGGPHRAVSLLGIEAIGRVAAEGNPIGPGTTGENLTVAGFDVSLLPLGVILFGILALPGIFTAWIGRCAKRFREAMAASF